MQIQTQTLILPLLLLLSLISLSCSLPAIPEPSLLIPSTINTNPTSTAPGTGTTTIPAFPEQSDVASLSCPLNPHDSLFPSLSLSCNPGTDTFSLSKCCPSLAAYLYAAYSATSLQVTGPSVSTPTKTDPLPVLPDDAEACAGSVDRVLREKGIKLPRGNGTCDMALCGCGVKLRRMTCQSGMFADVDGMWVPDADVARRLERECARPGLAGCGRCLRAVNKLKTGSGNLTASEKRSVVTDTHDQECQLMGLTWLLMRNGTRYLQSVTGALRALMVFEATGSTADPTVCSLPTDNMPLAVGSTQINGQDSSPAVRLLPTFCFLMDFLILLVFLFILSL